MEHNYIIASWGEWNLKNYKSTFEANPNFILIEEKNDLNLSQLQDINPRYIFFPHWSHIIPKEIYENFECIVFHMTDLPYGRGGSPLQNLIVRGHEKTKISALRVVKELDAGPIYLKKDLDLHGTAQEIFERASQIIFKELIPEFVKNEPVAKEQTGEITLFKRRKPEDGDLSELTSVREIHDYIRMLDAPGYPNAFLETKHFKVDFSDSAIVDDIIVAQVKIKLKDSKNGEL